MKLTIVLPAAAGMAVGYVLGSAAGRGRYRQIVTAVQNLLTHPRLQQVVFDLAGQTTAKAQHLPAPAADFVDEVATRVQDTLTQPQDDTSALDSHATEEGA